MKAENKINVAELLKDCPKGMELDCTMYDDVKFNRLQGNEYIIINRGYNGGEVHLTKFGQMFNSNDAKCVIFPKGKTTWEGFVPPLFKDGDVVVAEDSESFQLFLLKYFTCSKYGNSYNGYCYFGWNFDCNRFFEEGNWGFNRLATEEEKAKLFQAIKDNGYKWNAETKTLEKLIIPKFKVGDKIRHIVGREEVATVIGVEKLHYNLDSKVGTSSFSISLQHEWELVPRKFDITTLKPFDKVLVRDKNIQEWCISLFSHCNGLEVYKHSCINVSGYAQCIPYNEDTKHLLGTTNGCDDFYKTWEK